MQHNINRESVLLVCMDIILVMRKIIDSNMQSLGRDQKDQNVAQMYPSYLSQERDI